MHTTKRKNIMQALLRLCLMLYTLYPIPNANAASCKNKNETICYINQITCDDGCGIFESSKYNTCIGKCNKAFSDCCVG